MQAAFVEATNVLRYSATLAPRGTALNGTVTRRSGSDAFGLTVDTVTGYDATPTSRVLQRLCGSDATRWFARSPAPVTCVAATSSRARILVDTAAGVGPPWRPCARSTPFS